MIAIAKEAQKVADGYWPKEDNPLVNAPHTATETLAVEWTHPYSRMGCSIPLPIPTRPRNIGRQCRASTMSPATEIWFALARQWRSMSTRRSNNCADGEILLTIGAIEA
jgi:hypothetical protein